MGYELTNEQQVHADDYNHIKKVLARTNYIITFEDIRRWLKLEEEQQVATQMTSAKVHMPASNSRMVLRGKPGELDWQCSVKWETWAWPTTQRKMCKKDDFYIY